MFVFIPLPPGWAGRHAAQDKTHHGGQLAGDDLLLHLLGQRVLQCQVVSPVDEELVLQVLRRVEILAGRLLSVTPTLLQHSTVQTR